MDQRLMSRHSTGEGKVVKIKLVFVKMNDRKGNINRGDTMVNIGHITIIMTMGAIR